MGDYRGEGERKQMATSANSASGSADEVLLPPVSLSLRRPIILVIVLAIFALAVTGLIDRLLLGVLICAGLLIGLLNAVLVRRAVVRITSDESPSKQKMAYSSAARLLVITAIALVIGFLLKPDGIGLFFGLAVFQVISVVDTTVPVLKGLRRQS